MNHMLKAILFCVLAFSLGPVYAEGHNFKEMTLVQLQTVDTEGLEKKEFKAHRKALKKATKMAARVARRNAPKGVPYCSRAQKARGTCS
jgi:primosomal protein N'